MLHFMTDIFKTINQYDPHLWVWLGDAAYTDDIGKAVSKHKNFTLFLVSDDNSMPLEYVKERFSMTLSDPCKS